jgi:hypothetical protein
VKTASTALERVVIVVASLALSIGLIALMSGYFAGHDPAGVTGSVSGPGQAFRDQGHTLLGSGEARPGYDSSPPTSGPHALAPVHRDGSALSDDQLLSALQTGNVVFMYGTPTAPPGLASLARVLAPPFSPALAAAGQAVILAHRSGVAGVLGLAWTHLIRVGAPGDPLLRNFANFWLGRGAPAP